MEFFFLIKGFGGGCCHFGRCLVARPQWHVSARQLSKTNQNQKKKREEESYYKIKINLHICCEMKINCCLRANEMGLKLFVKYIYIVFFVVRLLL